MKRTILILLALAAILTAAPVENVISFQGKLVEGGAPVDGTRNIVFRIYDTDAGGVHLWEESHLGVSVVGGLFNVELGGATTFESEGVDFSEQYWVSIAVGGGAELSPRYKLTGTPYAMSDQDWRVDGNDMYTIPDGLIGIGTASPFAKVQITDTDNQTSLNVLNTVFDGSGFGNTELVKIRTQEDMALSGNVLSLGLGDGSNDNSNLILLRRGADDVFYVNADGDIHTTGRYYDSDGDAGTAGQILSSTATGTDWISGGSGGGLWTDGGTYIYPNNNTNIFVRDAGETRDIEIDMTSSSKWYGLFVDNTTTGFDAGSYREGYTKSAIGANVDDAGIRQCAIAGWSNLGSDSSASILGANTDGSVWGALGYKYGTVEYSAFFNDITYIGNQTSIGQPAAATSSELTIYDPDAASIDLVNNDETWRITNPVLNNLHFHNVGGPSNVLVLEHGTGYVGLSETNPEAGLHLTGSGYPGSFIICETGTGEDAGIRLHEGSDDKWHLLFEGSTEDFEIRNGDYNPYLTISQGNGYVGIGTTSPSAMLTISTSLIGLSGGLNLNRGTDDWYIYQDAAEGLRFRDDASEAMIIDSSGRVGINETSPSSDVTLHIKQLSDPDGIRLEENATSDYWDIGIASTENLWFEYNGSLTAWIDNTDGTWHTSDRRLKRDIEPIEGVLDKIIQLEPVSYYWKKNANPTRRSIGLIAQDVKAVFPDAAQIEEGYGYYGLNYDYISVLTLQGLIELNTEYQSTIDSQNARLETLESQIEMLKDEIESLKNN